MSRARLAKSAARIDGAMRTLTRSLLKPAARHLVRLAARRSRHIVQSAAGDVSAPRSGAKQQRGSEAETGSASTEASLTHLERDGVARVDLIAADRRLAD